MHTDALIFTPFWEFSTAAASPGGKLGAVCVVFVQPGANINELLFLGTDWDKLGHAHVNSLRMARMPSLVQGSYLSALCMIFLQLCSKINALLLFLATDWDEIGHVRENCLRTALTPRLLIDALIFTPFW